MPIVAMSERRSRFTSGGAMLTTTVTVYDDTLPHREARVMGIRRKGSTSTTAVAVDNSASKSILSDEEVQ